IEEDLLTMLAVLRRLDEHFHRDLLMDPVGWFQGRKWHGNVLSMLGQQDHQQERGVLDTLDLVWLSCGQVEQLPSLKVVRLSGGSEGYFPFQTLHDNLAFGLMLLDLLACWND